jgi:hypothetical protein
MTGGFTKLFSSIVTSSLWQEDNATRLVWITLLSLSDRTGFVSGSVPGLAHIARVPLEETAEALGRLSSPDPHSRTADNEGRRIEPVQGGWQILNYAHYRNKDATAAERQKRYRDKNLGGSNDEASHTPEVTSAAAGGRSGAPNPAGGSSAPPAQKPKPTESEVEDYAASIGLPRSDGAAMFLHWEEKGWGKVKNWKLTIQKWKAFGYLPSQKQQGKPKQADPNRQREQDAVTRFLRERKTA